VNDLPDELDPDGLPPALADGWSFDVASIEYAPVGFGSYHWIAADAAGTRRFVTVDDLDRKPWFGNGRDTAFEGLTRAFGTAVALRDAGLEFVLAPIPTANGTAVRRIDARYSLAVFPYAEGVSSAFGEHETPEQRATVMERLARLHRETPAVASFAFAPGIDLPGRRGLDAGLRTLDRPWTGGPYAERARAALTERAADVVDLLELFDRLRRQVELHATDPVITHGEPHAANVMWTDDGPLLIDWDTNALAPPERDLWMVLNDTGEEAAAYAAATGHRPDPVALDFYRLTWDLANVAAYVDLLRSPHADTDDMRKSYENLVKDLAVRDRWTARLG
jgi:spectinomycin phosphotransferase